MNTPENLLVLATHGTAAYPEKLRSHIRPEFDSRLKLNFSDFATAALIRPINKEQRLVPRYGRIAGDPARAEDAKDAFRTHDFGGVKIFKGDLPDKLKQECLDESHRSYHEEIRKLLLKVHGNTRDLLVVIDLHDTGNLILGENFSDDRPRAEKRAHPEITIDDGWHMPPVILSNNDDQTAPHDLMNDLKSAFRDKFKLGDGDVRTNWQFKGGYVTKTYGNPDNAALVNAKQERAVVQVELNRSLYVDERSQSVILNALAFYRERFTEVLTQVAGDYAHRAKP